MQVASQQWLAGDLQPAIAYMNLPQKNSSGDEIANVTYLYE